MKVSTSKYRHLKNEKVLFQYIAKKYKLETDQDIANFLFTSTSVISQVRNDKIGLSPTMILRVYDKTSLSIEKIREMVKQDATIFTVDHEKTSRTVRKHSSKA